jgi:catechol 2,3-dioxygenase-like lactoylglutathione lyase family enzyme
MKRLHVHVAVDNLTDSIKFYNGMFGTEPTVRKADYAKWMLDDPRVNFAISQRGAATGLNHLGIQVESGEELAQMQARLASLQPDVVKEENTACCYARSDKYWLTDPSGIQWETFHTLDQIPVFGQAELNAGEDGAQGQPGGNCCVPQTPQPAQSGCCAPKSQANGKASCC